MPPRLKCPVCGTDWGDAWTPATPHACPGCGKRFRLPAVPASRAKVPTPTSVSLPPVTAARAKPEAGFDVVEDAPPPRSAADPGYEVVDDDVPVGPAARPAPSKSTKAVPALKVPTKVVAALAHAPAAREEPIDAEVVEDEPKKKKKKRKKSSDADDAKFDPFYVIFLPTILLGWGVCFLAAFFGGKVGFLALFGFGIVVGLAGNVWLFTNMSDDTGRGSTNIFAGLLYALAHPSRAVKPFTIILLGGFIIGSAALSGHSWADDGDDPDWRQVKRRGWFGKPQAEQVEVMDEDDEGDDEGDAEPAAKPSKQRGGVTITFTKRRRR